MSGETILDHSTDVHEITGPSSDTDIDIIYNASLPALQALTTISAICTQYIKLESVNSRVLDDNLDPFKWWISADNKTMTNWAGPTGTIGCLCGITKSKFKG